MRQQFLVKVFSHFVVLAMIGCVFGKLNGPEDRGPIFSFEPPGKVTFANTKGLKVHCAATGSPKPIVHWIAADGTQVVPVLGLREIDPANGNLIVKPFSAEQYRPDIHAAVYKCSANNSVGVILSNDVQVRGVVLQPYDVQVYDSFAIEGNTAVFKCHIPEILGDFIEVVAWIKNDNLLIQTSDSESTSEKYTVTQSGDLLINEVAISESGSQYKCKTIHKLVNESMISKSGGRLFVTAPHGNVATKIVDLRTNIQTSVGGTAVLSCVAQGFPVPNIRWFRKEKNGKVTLIGEFAKNTMTITKVKSEDEGSYICEATSSTGKEQAEIYLNVLEPLKADIQPQVQVAKTKESVSFHCKTTGGDKVKFTWLRNGKIIQDESGSTLNIHNSDTANRGMYQCLVEENNMRAQAAVELRLSDIPPILFSTFNEVNLQPGDKTTLECSASGMPLPEISWDVDGIRIEGTENTRIETGFGYNGIVISSLTFLRVRVEDGGLYSCVAKNQVGESASSARINVFGPVKSRVVPARVAVSGSDAYLNCPYSGHPISSTAWQKDGISLPASRKQRIFKNGTTLIRKVSKLTDAGNYVCQLTTSTGNIVQSKVDLSIFVAPKIVPFWFQEELLREGMRARIQCVVSEGDFPLTITWMKDNLPLSEQSSDSAVNIRALDDYSSILNIGSINPRHNGNYTCVATNKAASVSHTAQLAVNVAPKIVPFSFQDVHYEGSTTRLVCGLLEGDLPVRFFWLKNDLPADTSSLSVHDIEGVSSILTIKNIGSEHAGNYTCVARNRVASAKHTAVLVVNVPPSWLLKPQAASVLNGDDLSLDCQAIGYPTPVISWMHTTNYKESEPVAVVAGENFNILRNGSLHIRRVDVSRAGYYFCQASNGIGNGLNTMVLVKIHAPPTIKTKLQMASVSNGNDFTMKCDAFGDATISAEWFKDGRRLSDSYSNNRYKIVSTEITSGITSSLTILKASRQDQGKYECVVKNNHGKNNMTFEIIVQEIPEPPRDIKVSVLGSRIIELSWQKAFDGNDPINKYVIEYITEFEDWENLMSVGTASGEIVSGTVTNLKPGTNYLFRMFGVNREGRSNSSPIVKGTTLEEAPSAVPANIHVATKNDNILTVTWAKSSEEQSQSGRITGYYVNYKEEGRDEPYLYKTLMTLDSASPEHSVHITNLRKFTKYLVTVQAYNAQGKGPASEPIIVMTSEGVPNVAPLNVRCTTLTSQSIHAAWAPPNATGINGILRNFRIVYKATSGWYEDETHFLNSTTSATTLTDLEKYTNYSIQVSAATKSGEGPLSEPIYCKTLDDVPDAPADVKALLTSETSVLVTWKPPLKPNGIIKSYNVYYRAANKVNDVIRNTLQVQYTQMEMSGLVKGLRYEFWVTAVNLAGEGKSSAILVQSPSGNKIPAHVIPFDEKVIIPWKSDVTLSCQAVGNPVPNRHWYHKDEIINGKNKLQITSDGSLVVRGIVEEESGDYYCVVSNDFNEDRVTYTVIVLVPPSPPTVEVIYSSSSSIEVKWNLNRIGSSRIQGYILHVRREYGEWKEIPLDPDVASYRLNGLECGTNYEIAMAAFNKIGLGDKSQPMLVQTNGSVPGKPPKEDLLEETATSVSINLNSWKVHSCPIQYYIVEYKVKGSGDWISAANNVKPEQRRLVVRDLAPATWHQLRITAHSSAGPSTGEYDFATMTITGATISPNVMLKDEAGNSLASPKVDLWVAVSAILAVLIVIVVLAMACLYVKRRKSHYHGAVGKDQQCRVNQTMHRGTLSRHTEFGTMSSAGYQDDPIPYATCRIGSHKSGTLPHSGPYPPVPPRQMDSFDPMDVQHKMMLVNGGFLPACQVNPAETTFIFPQGAGGAPMMGFPQRNN